MREFIGRFFVYCCAFGSLLGLSAMLFLAFNSAITQQAIGNADSLFGSPQPTGGGPPGELAEIIRAADGDPLEAVAMRGAVLIDADGERTDTDDRIGWHEADWVKWYASHVEGAEVEHHTADGSRVDILTPDYAIECDYAHKWDEGVGQCLFYAAATDRRPALLLLLHRGDDNDRRDYLRALVVCNKAGIRLIAVKIPPPAC